MCGVSVGAKRWSGAFKQSLRDSRIDPTEVLAERGRRGRGARAGQRQRGRLLRRHPRPHRRRDRPAGSRVPGAAVRRLGGGDRRRPRRRASGWCWRAPGWCWRRRAACWAGCKPLFSLGLGARLGNGRQYMPWISLEDEVRALMFAITHDELSGPGEPDRPAPVTNAEFTAALGRAVNRPTPMLVPGFALRARHRRIRRRGPARRSAGDPGGTGARRLQLPPQHHRRGAGVRDGDERS